MNFSGNRIEDEGFEIFLKLLKEKKFFEINLSNNRITNESIKLLINENFDNELININLENHFFDIEYFIILKKFQNIKINCFENIDEIEPISIRNLF